MKIYTTITWILLILLLVFSIQAMGQTKKLVFDSSKIEYKKMMLKGKSYEKIIIENAIYNNEVGKPDLPVFYYKFYVPKDKSVTDVTFIGEEKEEITLHDDLAPAQNFKKTSAIENDSLFDAPDPDIYGKDAFYPGKQATISRSDFVDGDLEVITIAVYPAQYNPVQKKVVLTLSGEINLITTSKNANYSNKFEGHSNEKEMATLVKTMVENPEDIKTDKKIVFEAASGSSLKSVQVAWSVPFYEYVVVTSRALKPAFNQFISWKKRKGYNAGIVCIEDILLDPAATGDNLSSPTLVDSAGKLRQYLYAGKMNISPKTKYALLGGDYTVVPIRYGKGASDAEWNDGTYKVPSDLYFSDFNSNWTAVSATMTGTYYAGFDYGPEIYVGRLLCNSEADVKRWTIKVLCYEQNPGNGNPAYLSKALMTEADGIGTINTSVLTLLNFTTINGYQEAPTDWSSQPTSPTGSDVISYLNSNYGLYCVFNHGRPNAFGTATAEVNSGALPRYAVTSSDDFVDALKITSENGNGFDNLTNYNYPTILYAVSCSNIPFDDYYYYGGVNRKIPTGSRTLGTSFTVAYSGGGPAYLGNTRDASDYNAKILATNFFDSISYFPQLGVAEAKSKIGGFYDHSLRLSHNLLGCPETELWTSTPTLFSQTINPNGTTVAVNAGESGSTICLMSALDNGSSYYISKNNVSSWTFTGVPYYPNTTILQPYYVTITKHNKIPYLQNPTTVLIENTTFSSLTYLNCQTVSAGYSVNPNTTDGNVVVATGANVTFDATGDILLANGFEVQLGATFEAK